MPIKHHLHAASLCWVTSFLLACGGPVWSQDLTQPVDVPDEVGLGERLALIAWLGEHKIAITDPHDLPALRLAYLKAAHPERLADARKAADTERRGELAAELYRKHGINPPTGADAGAIRALIVQMDAKSDETLARDRAKAQVDAATHPVETAPPADGAKPADTPERVARGIVIGKKFPAFAGRTLDGNAFTLTQWRGKVVLIDFWATWCPPSMAWLPDIKALYQKYHARGFEIIGVSLDQDQEVLQQVLTERGIAWPQLFDGRVWESRFAAECVVDSIPDCFLIGKDGTLLTVDLLGPELEQAVVQALDDR